MKHLKILILLGFCLNVVAVMAFDYSYQGVTFKCKVLKGTNTVVITAFDRKAPKVVVPATVVDKAITYEVKEVSTFVNGDNYSAQTLELEEGIERVGRSSFIEFRRLQQVKLPSTLQQVGRNAFRNNEGLEFTLPQGLMVYENSLRTGTEVNIGVLVASVDDTQSMPVTQPQPKPQPRKTKPQPQKEPEPVAPVQTQPKPDVAFVSDIDQNIPVGKMQNPETYVVIVANEKYKYQPHVDYAERDGLSFKQYCVKTLGIPERQIRMYSNASLGEIYAAIKWLEGITVYEEQARLIFYYAGHGQPDAKSADAYLVPVDGLTETGSTCVKMQDLYDRLGKISAQSVVVLLDACFSGMQRGLDKPLVAERGMARAAKKETLGGNVVVLSASSGDQTAMTYKDQQHGLFTYFLLKHLQEQKGKTTLNALYEYVKRNVAREAHLNDKAQTPVHAESQTMKVKWKDLRF